MENPTSSSILLAFAFQFRYFAREEFKIDNALIVCISKQEVNEVEKIIKYIEIDKNINIDILPIDKIQALEYDVVILLAEENTSRTYISENDKLLNVVISRARKGFIALCAVNACMESAMGNVLQQNEFQVINPSQE